MRKEYIIIVICMLIVLSCGNRQSKIINRFGVIGIDPISRKEEISNIMGETITLLVPKFNPDDDYIGGLDDVFDSIYFTRLETIDFRILQRHGCFLSKSGKPHKIQAIFIQKS